MQATQDRPDLLFIDNIQTLVAALMTWHDQKVQILEYMMTVPSGTEMTINDSETIVLDGDALKGFCAGITVALAELGTLPFEVTVDAEESPATEASNNTQIQDADHEPTAPRPVH